MTFKEVPDLTQEEEYFNSFYKKHEVEIVGEWINVDNPKEVYYISGYKDEDHYKQFIAATKEDPKYQEFTSSLEAMRESVEMVNLTRPDRPLNT